MSHGLRQSASTSITAVIFAASVAAAWCQPEFTQVLHGVLDGRSEFIWNGGQRYVYPAFGDVDADGDLDLFLGNFGDVSFFRNDGTPRSPRWTFVNRNHLGLDPDDHWPAPAMCDIDADGFEDLFVATWNSELLYYSASPTGLTLVTRNFIPDIGGSARLVIYPEFADLDGDGDFDLLIGVSQREGPAPEPGLSGTVLHYRNDGTPQAPAMTALGNALGLSVSPEFVVTPELLDLDGDGDLDALLGTGDVWNRTQYRFVRFENVGSITTPSFVSQETGFLASHVRPDVPGLNAEAVDLDGDTRSELVLADEWTLHTVLRLSSTASPEWEPDVSLLSHFESRADYPGSSCTYDIDDDGDQDLFIGAVGNVEFYRNVGSPAAPHWRTESTALLPVPQGFFQAGRSLYPQVCDIDADGDGDMFVTGEYANNRIVLFENAGTPSSPDWTVDNMIDNWQGISVPHNLHICFGDLDGDGDLDMISSNRQGDSGGTWTDLHYRQNIGDAATASYAAPVSLQAVPSYPPSFDGYHYEDCAPSLADLDGDGDLDLLAAAVMSTQFRSASWINLFENSGTATAPTFAASPDVLNILPFALREAGYVLTSDLNGDGQADVLCGDSDGGLRYFQQASASLSISPAGATVPSGQALSLATPSATGTVTWSFLRNASGATLNPSTGLYTAGASTEVVDTVRARDDAGTPGDLSDDLIGQAHIHVISAASVAQAGRAVIVAGTRSADTLWPSTDFLAETAHQTLLDRGFTASTITYLSNDAGPEVDGQASLASLQAAIESLPPGTNRLFLYLVDHGGDTSGSGYVRLNPTETVTGAQLDAWLDALQTAQGTDVSVVIDCCRSGSFLDEMVPPAGQERVVVASTLADQDAFFTAGGHVSFSDALLGAVEGGLTLGEAFDLAQGAMDRYQRAQLDDNGDGLYDRDADGALARTWEIGASFTAGSDRPQIGQVSANQTLTGGDTDALIWADDITGASAVERVWAVVVSPEFQPNPDNLGESPIESLPEHELVYDPVDQRYEATLTGLSSLGAYKVILYARDVWGGVAFPKQTYINQTNSTEELVLLASDQAYDANSPASWSSQVINYAYEVALSRLFPPANITVLDAAGNGILESVDDPPTEAALLSAIAGASGASQLTVQLAGPGSAGGFEINAGDTLTASELDAALDSLQTASPGTRVVVIIDCPSSGSFLSNLAGANRVVIASTGADLPSWCEAGGLINFSRWLWSRVAAGANVRECVAFARNAIRFCTALTQSPVTDDNGDGLNSSADGALSVVTFIGAAFVTGGEPPTFGQISENVVIPPGGGAAATLWASDVLDSDGIAQVWVEIMEPGFDPLTDTAVSIELMWASSEARYQATHAGFTEDGDWALAFFARDTTGDVSLPVVTRLLHGGDAFEIDDTVFQAGSIAPGLPAQTHTFHSASDEDWVWFVAEEGLAAYTIQTQNQSATCDTRLTVIGENGSVELIDEDFGGAGPANGETVSFLCSDQGLYFIRVRPGDFNTPGSGCQYELLLSRDSGANNGLAEIVSAGRVGLGWGPVPTNAGYHVFRSSGGPFIQITSLPITPAQYEAGTWFNTRKYNYIDHNASGFTTYTYQVRTADFGTIAYTGLISVPVELSVFEAR